MSQHQQLDGEPVSDLQAFIMQCKDPPESGRFSVMRAAAWWWMCDVLLLTQVSKPDINTHHECISYMQEVFFMNDQCVNVFCSCKLKKICVDSGIGRAKLAIYFQKLYALFVCFCSPIIPNMNVVEKCSS